MAINTAARRYAFFDEGMTFPDNGTSAFDRMAQINFYYLVGGGGDTTPDQFTIQGQSGVPRSTVITSAGVIPVGYDTATAVTSSGCTCAINGGAYSTSPGNCSPGDTITARLTSSASYSTLVSGTVTIGSVSANFNVTTLANVPAGGANKLKRAVKQAIKRFVKRAVKA